MTESATRDSDQARQAAERSDQERYPFGYDHGRMPTFMKVIWLAFLAGGTWYVVSFLLESLGGELGG